MNFDDDTFYVVNEPWLLSLPGTGDALRPEQVKTLVLHSERSSFVVLPLFTDEHLAELYVASCGRDGNGIEPFQLENWFELYTMLQALQSLGVSHVTFDPEASGPVRFRTRTIDEVLARIRAPQ